jgi:hypothetical protein
MDASSSRGQSPQRLEQRRSIASSRVSAASQAASHARKRTRSLPLLTKHWPRSTVPRALRTMGNVRRPSTRSAASFPAVSCCRIPRPLRGRSRTRVRPIPRHAAQRFPRARPRRSPALRAKRPPSRSRPASPRVPTTVRWKASPAAASHWRRARQKTAGAAVARTSARRGAPARHADPAPWPAKPAAGCRSARTGRAKSRAVRRTATAAAMATFAEAVRHVTDAARAARSASTVGRAAPDSCAACRSASIPRAGRRARRVAARAPAANWGPRPRHVERTARPA